MIIGVNANEANVAHRVGINQFAFEILKRLKPDVVYLSQPPLPDMPPHNYKIFGPQKMWTLTGLQKEILTNPPDILLSLTHYAPLLLRSKSIISIMDLSFEKFPHYFKKSDLYQLKYWTRVSASQASHIITISENSKRDIVDLYKISPEKISVVYPGYDTEKYNTEVKPSKKYGNYLLYLGTLQPRKNLERLIEAFRLLEPRTYNLVIAGMRDEGRGGWMNEKIKSSKDIILTGYVSEEEKPGLYAGAKAYVLPSLYEGFGIPPIEAMAVGTPVIVSRVSSLPEICGDAATYIEDPYDVESIKTALIQGVSKDKVKLGLKQVLRYNWDKSAREIQKILYEV